MTGRPRPQHRAPHATDGRLAARRGEGRPGALPSLWPGALLLVLLSIALFPPPLSASGALHPDALPSPRDPWTEIRTEHFRLLTDGDPDRVEALALDLEGLRAVLSHLYPQARLDSPLPTRIFVFRDRRSLAPYALEGGPRPAGRGADDGRVQGYFFRSQDAHYLVIDGDSRCGPGCEPRQVLYHEFLHFVAETNFQGLPLWLGEGLAEVYSTFSADGDRAVVGLPVAEHLETLRLHRPMALEDLVAVDLGSPVYTADPAHPALEVHAAEGRGRGAPVGGARTVFYAQSWALTHYLMFHPDPAVWEGLSTFLHRTRRGDPAVTAFREAFGLALEDLPRELTRYVHQERLPGVAYALGELPGLSGGEGRKGSVTRRPVERVEVLVSLGELLTHTRRRSAAGLSEDDLARARAHFEAALAEAASRDASLVARARTGLGELLEARHQGEAARRLYREALALTPDSARVHTLLGQSLLRELTGDGRFAIATDPESRALAEEARRHFARATMEPDAPPEAHVGRGTAHLFLEVDPTPGIEALRTARRLFPDRPEIAINLGVLYARVGRMDRARGLLAPLTSSEDPEVAAVAREALLRGELRQVDDQLRQGRTEEAHARLEGLLPGVEDPGLRTRLTLRAAELREILDHNRWVRRYNRAVEAARAGSRTEALELLDQVLAGARAPEILEPARQLQGKLLAGPAVR